MRIELRHRVLPRVRCWVRSVGATAARIAWARSLPALSRDGPPRRIAVVGAGLAGLSAALLLKQLGHEVTVLEARQRFGGRILTLREAFPDGLYADAGGFRISIEHHLARRWARRLGLALEPFYPFPADGLGVVSIGGTRFLRRPRERLDASLLPRPLDEEECWIFQREIDDQVDRVVGGADVFPRAFADRLSGVVQYGAPVVSIAPQNGGVRVGFLREGARSTLDVDRVVCAVPCSTLRDIEIPALSSEKRAAIEALSYAPATLTYLLMRRRYWTDQGLSGFAVTDSIGEVWHATHRQRGSRGILIAYAKGPLAEHVGTLDQDGRAGVVLDGLESVLPGARDNIEWCTSLSWRDEVWSRGAQSQTSLVPPACLEEIRRAEGPLHFAGEHTAASHQGWMEGALRAGWRAAFEASRER
jgi:monoamine oxidase